MRLPRPIDAATQARVSAQGRRCRNPPSLQSPSVMTASLFASGLRRYEFLPTRGSHPAAGWLSPSVAATEKRSARAQRARTGVVAVGTALTSGPPHRSQRAELPHWAPVSGFGGEAYVRVGMHHTSLW